MSHHAVGGSLDFPGDEPNTTLLVLGAAVKGDAGSDLYICSIRGDRCEEDVR